MLSSCCHVRIWSSYESLQHLGFYYWLSSVVTLHEKYFLFTIFSSPSDVFEYSLSLCCETLSFLFLISLLSAGGCSHMFLSAFSFSYPTSSLFSRVSPATLWPYLLWVPAVQCLCYEMLDSHLPKRYSSISILERCTNNTHNISTPFWCILNSLPFAQSCSWIAEIHWAACFAPTGSAVNVQYGRNSNTYPHGALPSWKPSPAPTAPLISQVAQGHLLALHSLFLFWSIWTTTGWLKAWHLVCTEIYFLVIQNPIHNLNALLPGSLNWMASFHFVLFQKTKFSFCDDSFPFSRECSISAATSV